MGLPPFPGKTEQARRWLRAYLADGQVRPAQEVIVAGMAAGHTKRTLQRAARQVALVAPTYDERGVACWQWSLSPASSRLWRLPAK